MTIASPPGGSFQATKAPAATQRRMDTTRELFRLRRLARDHRRLWFFYLEHNLFEEAVTARQKGLELLRRACQQWRMLLGTGS